MSVKFRCPRTFVFLRTLLFWAPLYWALTPCDAQTPCVPGGLEDIAGRVRGIQGELRQVHAGELDTEVPATVSDQLVQLKEGLSCIADTALAQAGRSIDTVDLRNKLSGLLTANPPDTADYGGDLTVSVRRPPNAQLLEIEFSVGIPCGDDHVLLVYAMDNATWKKKLRWQAPPLKEVSDAFGDFFASGLVASSGGTATPLVVVAHGTPWCTSRFSGFSIDVLSTASSPDSPKVLWHMQRGYSRGDFAPELKSSGNTFELRINDSSFDIDSFERRVIYRYRVDAHQVVHRIGPIAINAQGFVEEWLSAPWEESAAFSAERAVSSLSVVHKQFAGKSESESEFVTHSHGAVRACNARGDFQVEVRSTLVRIVPGKPGGESRPLPTDYFHVREIKDGYLMMSAGTEPDPGCKGADLMPKDGK